MISEKLHPITKEGIESFKKQIQSDSHVPKYITELRLDTINGVEKILVHRKRLLNEMLRSR